MEFQKVFGEYKDPKKFLPLISYLRKRIGSPGYLEICTAYDRMGYLNHSEVITYIDVLGLLVLLFIDTTVEDLNMHIVWPIELRDDECIFKLIENCPCQVPTCVWVMGYNLVEYIYKPSFRRVLLEYFYMKISATIDHTPLSLKRKRKLLEWKFIETKKILDSRFNKKL